MAFRSRGLGYEFDFGVVLLSYSTSSTIFNLNCRLKCYLPKWPHAEFNRGLLSPFYHIQKESCTNSLSCLRIIIMDIVQGDPEKFVHYTI